MRDVFVLSVGMIPFGKHPSKGVKQLTGMVFKNLLDNSPLGKEDIQAAWFSNAGWGFYPHDQHCIRGQVALAPTGLEQIPIMNVENACASGSCAFHGAYLGIASGMYDIALAIGVEKMSPPRSIAESENPELLQKLIQKEGKTEEELIKSLKKNTLASFMAGTDVEVTRQLIGAIKAQADKEQARKAKEGGSKSIVRKERSPFMDFYSMATRDHMKKYGTTQEQLAIIAAKSHNNGALNPNAQYRFTMTPQEVMNDDLVSYPLTRAMCAPIGDGAAAAILVSGDYLKKLTGARPVKVRATVLGSASMSLPGEDRAAKLAKKAYEMAGVGPEDIDMAEVHDASSYGELVQTENLGFCPRGEGGPFAASGETALGGKFPVNTSGGLLSRGHPIGASGLAMLAECFYQLTGRADKRQVEGARLAMIENGGGWIGTGEASIVMNILEAPSKG